MRRSAGACLGLLGLVLVGGCNVVITEKPLLTQADAAGAPPLRPGVWSFFHEQGCKIDESRPFADWSSCAGGGIVRDGEILGHNASKSELEHMPLIIAAGDPRIAQMQIKIDVSVGAEAKASGGAQASASASATTTQTGPPPYGYLALKPTKFDREGRITAFRFWPVQCGPPPPQAKASDLTGATQHLLPGLERASPNDVACTTHSVEALRNAARASEAWDDQKQESHWVRDGER